MPAMTGTRARIAEVLFNRRMLICIFTGFSSGLPLWLLINLLPAWLRSEQVDLTSNGLFALMQLPFTWKFLWSPLLDRYALPMLGRRRGWMLITQIALLISIPLFVLMGEILFHTGLALKVIEGIAKFRVKEVAERHGAEVKIDARHGRGDANTRGRVGR